MKQRPYFLMFLTTIIASFLTRVIFTVTHYVMSTGAIARAGSWANVDSLSVYQTASLISAMAAAGILIALGICFFSRIPHHCARRFLLGVCAYLAVHGLVYTTVTTTLLQSGTEYRLFTFMNTMGFLRLPVELFSTLNGFLSPIMEMTATASPVVVVIVKAAYIIVVSAAPLLLLPFSGRRVPPDPKLLKPSHFDMES